MTFLKSWYDKNPVIFFPLLFLATFDAYFEVMVIFAKVSESISNEMPNFCANAIIWHLSKKNILQFNATLNMSQGITYAKFHHLVLIGWCLVFWLKNYKLLF